MCNNYKKKNCQIKKKGPINKKQKETKYHNFDWLNAFFLLSKTSQLSVLLFAAKSFFILFFKHMPIKKFDTFIDTFQKKKYLNWSISPINLLLLLNLYASLHPPMEDLPMNTRGTECTSDTQMRTSLCIIQNRRSVISFSQESSMGNALL
ncbi:hypothetical protein RFI_38471 [Reticulomyxa filosa]|uniref:Uncharacterized protein n=1 Tax=Reticulomyxa filosa TaxID=46433 RepID=X6LD17_RETFI|nr:hypothetical protein RFI_38471 [Reticulomyxa filosa]|eukprot:ETN99016.1 hypothetical protein RFI_38471 [Reticulomyxa filosa]